MTRRLAIFGLILAAVVFVTTLNRPVGLPSQWPPVAWAAASAAMMFFWIWFIAPLIAWVGSAVLLRLSRVLERPTSPKE